MGSIFSGNAFGATGSPKYQGTWNANTNSPTLASGVGTQDYYYIVGTAGATNLDGITDWVAGDWAIFNGTAWQKIDQTNTITSVFTRVGAIVAATNDYTWGQIDKTTSSIADITTRSHTALTDIGTNTHANIDTFIGTKAQASGLASLNGSGTVVQDPANAQLSAAANKIPLAGVGGTLATGWIPDLSGTYATAAKGVTNGDSHDHNGGDGATIPIAGGGTGQTTAQLGINALTAVSAATNEHVLTKDTATGNAIFKAAAAGGSKPDAVIRFPAGSFSYLETAIAPLDTDTGTNGKIQRNLFSISDYVNGNFVVPSDVTSGNVTIVAYGYSVTAAASKQIQLTFFHSAIADSESWDAAYAEKKSADLDVDATQDDLDYFAWTETVANLGWTANDHVRFKLGRIAIVDGGELSGDWGLTHFEIRIPRA